MDLTKLIAHFAEMKQKERAAKADRMLAEAELHQAMIAQGLTSGGNPVVGKVACVFDKEFILEPEAAAQLEPLVADVGCLKEELSTAKAALEEAQQLAVEAGHGKVVETIRYIKFTAPKA